MIITAIIVIKAKHFKAIRSLYTISRNLFDSHPLGDFHCSLFKSITSLRYDFISQFYIIIIAKYRKKTQGLKNHPIFSFRYKWVRKYTLHEQWHMYRWSEQLHLWMHARIHRINLRNRYTFTNYTEQ